MAQPTRAGLEVLYPVRIEFEDPLVSNIRIYQSERMIE
jgi:hypothetical protein